MRLHSDFTDLLQAFAEDQVEYLVVGGYAVGFHARPRYTKDIDLWVGEDPENLARVAAALRRFGAPENVVCMLETASPDEIIWMGAPPMRVDILQRIPGVEFAEAYSRRVQVEWAGVPALVIDIDDLIRAKRASASEQDLLDVRELERSR